MDREGSGGYRRRPGEDRREEGLADGLYLPSVLGRQEVVLLAGLAAGPVEGQLREQDCVVNSASDI